jgi:hypothetical protein
MLFKAAVDFLSVAGQADRLDHRALAQGLPGAFDFQILDRDHAVAVGKHVSTESRTSTVSAQPRAAASPAGSHSPLASS